MGERKNKPKVAYTAEQTAQYRKMVRGQARVVKMIQRANKIGVRMKVSSPPAKQVKARKEN